ncbi:hypothetical protein F511_17996 [Dorcoceras hygrometricum]|uniref:Uncharacterized protein n=1 Tax=Dorcoceras hygrometricum TaxID=472368 RepID=A0A2Z7CYC8_9LAMI|nr:hypothetical protein F511_17996 [Dorcoceras hygrometricum]
MHDQATVHYNNTYACLVQSCKHKLRFVPCSDLNKYFNSKLTAEIEYTHTVPPTFSQQPRSNNSWQKPHKSYKSLQDLRHQHEFKLKQFGILTTPNWCINVELEEFQPQYPRSKLIGQSSVIGKLPDVCIAIGSLATLDLQMVVDLIGIYGLKGPYCYNGYSTGRGVDTAGNAPGGG